MQIGDTTGLVIWCLFGVGMFGVGRFAREQAKKPPSDTGHKGWRKSVPRDIPPAPPGATYMKAEAAGCVVPVYGFKDVFRSVTTPTIEWHKDCDQCDTNKRISDAFIERLLKEIIELKKKYVPGYNNEGKA